MNRDRLLQRFLSYVQVDTTADDSTTDYPSSQGQWDLGRRLVDELTAMGASDVVQDEWALVWATVPATNGRDGPAIAFNAHLDTSPETTGAGVRPRVIENYQGGDIPLGAGDLAIRLDENPELEQLIGKTLITTDGTTLLGGDDKAGVAVIMEMAAHLLENPQLAHGPIRILFTCDEEIGRGVDHVDPKELSAAAGYTLDGPGADQIDVETFSADLATVTVRGVNIHPSIAKDRMVNAIRGAAAFVERLPKDRLSPETTEGREGFLHPYQAAGGVDEFEIRILLRSFDNDGLSEQAELLHQLARETCREISDLSIDVQVRPQYRNLGDGLQAEPRAVKLAQRAHDILGRTARQSSIRGGTDGSLLTAKGLPTPNLSTGQHNPHSPLEWACLDEMLQAGELLVELVKLWGEQ